MFVFVFVLVCEISYNTEHKFDVCVLHACVCVCVLCEDVCVRVRMCIQDTHIKFTLCIIQYLTLHHTHQHSSPTPTSTPTYSPRL